MTKLYDLQLHLHPPFHLLFFLSLPVIAHVQLHRLCPQEIYWTKADLLLINKDIFFHLASMWICFFHFFDWPQYMRSVKNLMAQPDKLGAIFHKSSGLAIWANQISLPSMRPVGNSVMLPIKVSGDTTTSTSCTSTPRVAPQPLQFLNQLFPKPITSTESPFFALLQIRESFPVLKKSIHTVAATVCKLALAPWFCYSWLFGLAIASFPAKDADWPSHTLTSLNWLRLELCKLISSDWKSQEYSFSKEYSQGNGNFFFSFFLSSSP